MRSPSPHSIRSSQLKNKITDTSLFAELVKDKHKREQELKKLLDQQSDSNKPNTNEEPTPPPQPKPNTDEIDNAVNHDTNPVPMDIDDIPIPSDNKCETPVKLNEISLPITSIELTPTVPPPLPPIQSTAKLPATIKLNNSFTLSKKPESKSIKTKSITKLPMPPGINQTDLEAIESPPSRSPTPPPITKPKTPPRKGIMNLPMPPGTPIRINSYKCITIYMLCNSCSRYGRIERRRRRYYDTS